jgi:hypothetical protein
MQAKSLIDLGWKIGDIVTACAQCVPWLDANTVYVIVDTLSVSDGHSGALVRPHRVQSRYETSLVGFGVACWTSIRRPPLAHSRL